MIVKKVIGEEILTLVEVKEILNQVNASRSNKEGEEDLYYDLRRAIRHVNTFAKMDGDKAREIVNQLLKLDKMEPD